MFEFDIVKNFIKDFKSSDIPHELKKREYAMSKSEARRFKDKTALARKRQHERRDQKRRDLFFKKSTSRL